MFDIAATCRLIYDIDPRTNLIDEDCFDDPEMLQRILKRKLTEIALVLRMLEKTDDNPIRFMALEALDAINELKTENKGASDDAGQ